MADTRCRDQIEYGFCNAHDLVDARAEVERLKNATHPFAITHLKVLEERDALRAVLEAIAAMSKWTDGERAIQLARDTFDNAKPG